MAARLNNGPSERVNTREYARERAYFVIWGRWASFGDDREIALTCGLTRFCSPPNTMPDTKEDGGERDGVVEYIIASFTPSKLEELGTEVNDFAEALAEVDQGTYRALLARHRRFVDGTRFLLSSDARMAAALYPEIPKGPAHAFFCRNCERGYRLLREYLERKSRGLQVA